MPFSHLTTQQVLALLILREYLKNIRFLDGTPVFPQLLEATNDDQILPVPTPVPVWQTQYQNETYVPNYQQQQPQQQQIQEPPGYYSRLQPPVPFGNPVPTENMYRGRGSWRHPQNFSRGRGGAPYRRRRSHLDDIYLPNYDDNDDLTEHDDLDFQSRDRNSYRNCDGWSNSSHHRRDDNRRPYFKVISTENHRRNVRIPPNKGNSTSKEDGGGNKNFAKDKSHQLKQRSNDNSASIVSISNSSTNDLPRDLSHGESDNAKKLDKNENSITTQCLRQKTDVTESVSDKNNCDISGTINKISKTKTINDDSVEYVNKTNEVKTISDTYNNNKDKQELMNLKLGNSTKVSNGIKDISSNIDANETLDRSNAIQSNDIKQNEKTDIIQASKSVTEPICINTSSLDSTDMNSDQICPKTPELAEPSLQSTPKLVFSPSIPLKLSPKNKSKTSDNDEHKTELCHLLPTEFPVWKSMLEEVKAVIPVTDLDSDQETVCFDDFITIDNIDTTKSFLKSLDDSFMDDYRTIDMEIGTPSPVKRKTEDECSDLTSTKKKKYDYLYSEINSDDLLNQINEVLKEDKQKCKPKKCKSIKRFRSKSLNLDERLMKTNIVNRSKSEERIYHNPVAYNFDLKTNLLSLLSDNNEIVTDPSESVENILKVFKEIRKNQACTLESTCNQNCGIPEQQSTIKHSNCEKDSIVAAKIIENTNKSFNNNDVKIGDEKNDITNIFHQQASKSCTSDLGEKGRLDDNLQANKVRSDLTEKITEVNRSQKDQINIPRRRSHDKEIVESESRKRRAEHPPEKSEKQIKYGNEKIETRHQITLGEYKKTVDVSRKFPPPKIDLNIVRDENYRIKRTSYSSTDLDLQLIEKLHKLFGNDPDTDKDAKIVTEIKSDADPRKRDEKTREGEKGDPKPKIIFHENNKEKSVDKRRHSLPASSVNDKNKNDRPRPSSSKSDKTSHTQSDKKKVIKKGERRTSVPASIISSTRSHASNGVKYEKSISQNDSFNKQVANETTKKRDVSADKTESHKIEAHKRTSNKANVKTNHPQDRTSSKIKSTKPVSNDGNEKKEKKLNIVKTTEKTGQGNSSGLKTENSEKKDYNKVGNVIAINTDCTNLENDPFSKNCKNPQGIKGTEPIDLQAKVVIQRVDKSIPIDCISPVRQINERVHFALISEVNFIKCSVLCQERFPMRQKARQTLVENECCDQVVVLENAEIHDDAVKFKQPIDVAKKSDSVKDQELDDVIEIKAQIPIIDLTEDSGNKEVNGEKDIKNDLKEEKQVSAEKKDIPTDTEVITLYRSEETSNNSLDVQAMVASISPMALKNKSVSPDIKIDDVEIVDQESLGKATVTDSPHIPHTTSTTTIQSISKVESMVREHGKSPVSNICQLSPPLSTLSNNTNEHLTPRNATCNVSSRCESQDSTYSLVGKAINDAIKQRERLIVENGRDDPGLPNCTPGLSNVSQIQTPQLIRSSGLFIPPEVISRTTDQTGVVTCDRSQVTSTLSNKVPDNTFVKPCLPHSSSQNANILSKKPRNGPQYEVIQSPRRPDIDDHHTLMVVPPSPRRTEDGPNFSLIPQSSSRAECAIRQQTLTLVNQTPRAEDANNLSAAQSPRRINTGDVIQPGLPQTSRISESNAPIESFGQVRQSPRRNDSSNQNIALAVPGPDASVQEITKVGLILMRFLCFFDALKKSQFAYTEELKKYIRFLPTNINRELKLFEDANIKQAYDLSRDMVGEIRKLNLAGITEDPQRAQALVESAFKSLKKALPHITLSWVYLMLEVLMRPEMVHYIAVPFLKAIYNVVGLVTFKIRQSASGQQQGIPNSEPPRDVFSPDQLKLLEWQIEQYRVICSNQKTLMLYEQNLQNNIKRTQQQVLVQNNSSNCSQCYPSIPLPSQYSANTVGKPVALSGNSQSSSFTNRNSNADFPGRNSSSTLKSILMSNVSNTTQNASSRVPPETCPNVTIHSNILLPLNPAAPQSYDAHRLVNSTVRKSKKITKGSKGKKTPNASDDHFKIRLPFTVPYDLLPSSTVIPSLTTTTSIVTTTVAVATTSAFASTSAVASTSAIASTSAGTSISALAAKTATVSNQNMSIHSPAVHRILQNSPMRSPARRFFVPLTEGTAQVNVPDLSPVIEGPSPVYAPIIFMNHRSTDSVSPKAAEEPVFVTTPTSEKTDKNDNSCQPEPSTSEESKTKIEVATVKDEIESQGIKEIETIDLTWMDDIDPEQLQNEIEFITIKKEEPHEQTIEAEGEVEDQVENEVEEHMQDPHIVTPSPADSGISSPPAQVEYNEQVFFGRTCICGQPADYVCGCRMAMYCSEPCQARDWKTHKEMCQKHNAKIKEAALNQADESADD